VNTYAHHRWNVKIQGKVVKTWIIKESSGSTINQEFILSANDMIEEREVAAQ
jgi:hypothetical protein